MSFPYQFHGDPADAETISTDAILSAATTMDIGPGVKAQVPHRDDFIWQTTHTSPCKNGYQLGRDVTMGLLVPGVKTTEENGATRVLLSPVSALQVIIPSLFLTVDRSL